MIRRLTLSLLPIAAAIALTVPVHAQLIRVELDEFGNPALRIGQDYTLRQGENARQAIVIGGDATIEGHVNEDLVVVLGKAQLASTAEIGGNVVLVGGTISAAEGAQVHNDLVVIGGLDAATGFHPGGQQVVIGTAALGNWLRGLGPWLMRGLLWGRPIVPDLPWVWAMVGLFFLVNLVINFVFDAPVRATATTLRATPLSAFMTGLLVMLLVGPVCVLLAVSVIGIVVIPFVLCALLLGTVIGKVGLARWIGMSVIAQDQPEDRLQSLRSFVIGSALICLAYMVPVLGFVVWTVCAVLGLGASAMAFFTAYRRENPRPPRPVPVTEPPPVAGPGSSAPIEAQPAAFAAIDTPPSAYAGGASAIEGTPLAFDPARPVYAAPGPAASAAVSLLAFPRALFKDRLAAFALDFILVMIVAQMLGSNRHDDDVVMRLLLIVSLAYHVGFWTWKGTTLGGIICNLRLVRTDGAPLKFAEALVRGLTGIFSLLVLGLGFLWVLRDPERQAWHDRVAGTYVVKVPRAWPI
jgi:uncharacterized RDD family membrane protein YckC